MDWPQILFLFAYPIITFLCFATGINYLKNLDKKSLVLKDILEKKIALSNELYNDIPVVGLLNKLYWSLFNPNYAKTFLFLSAIVNLVLGCATLFLLLMSLIILFL